MYTLVGWCPPRFPWRREDPNLTPDQTLDLTVIWKYSNNICGSPSDVWGWYPRLPQLNYKVEIQNLIIWKLASEFYSLEKALTPTSGQECINLRMWKLSIKGIFLVWNSNFEQHRRTSNYQWLFLDRTKQWQPTCTLHKNTGKTVPSIS